MGVYGSGDANITISPNMFGDIIIYYPSGKTNNWIYNIIFINKCHNKYTT